MTSLDRLENTQKPTDKVENPYKVKNLEHLGLISAQFDALGLVELIDTMVPQCREKRKVSIGQAVKAMVINGLGFANHNLYLMPEFFADKPVELPCWNGIYTHWNYQPCPVAHLNYFLTDRDLILFYPAVLALEYQS